MLRSSVQEMGIAVRKSSAAGANLDTKEGNNARVLFLLTSALTTAILSVATNLFIFESSSCPTLSRFENVVTFYPYRISCCLFDCVPTECLFVGDCVEVNINWIPWNLKVIFRGTMENPHTWFLFTLHILY